MNDLIFTVFPPSRITREKLEKTLAETPAYLSLKELKNLSIRGIFCRLLSIRANRILLLIEDPRGSSLIPILHLLASLTRSRKIARIDDLYRSYPLSRFRVVSSIFSILKAALNGQWALRKTRNELSSLLKTDRIASSPFSPQKILYLKTHLWGGVKAGGSLAHTAGLINALVDLGRNVTFVSTDEPILLADAVKNYPLSPLKSYGIPGDINLYRYHHEIFRQLSPSDRFSGHDLIYQRHGLSNYVGVTLSRTLKIPLILEYNGSEVWCARNWGKPPRYETLAKQAETVCLKHAHLIVTISEVLRTELLDRGVEPHRIVCYPNGVDPVRYDANRFSEDEIHQCRDEYNISRDAMVFTFLGTFGPWHGAEVFAQAILQLVTSDRALLETKNIHFLFVGDGEGMSTVRNTLADPEIQPFLTLAGLVPQEEAPQILAASDVFVSPHVPNPDGTPFFGSPTKLFEYMSVGRGLIASELDQIGEILRGSPHIRNLTSSSSPEAGCAILATPGDTEDLKQAIRFLIENPSWIEQIGPNARNRVLNQYTWNHHVDAILKALEPALHATGQEKGRSS